KLQKSYSRGKTRHDLFDQLYDKASVVEDAERVQLELISLAEGDKKIVSQKSQFEISRVLDIGEDRLGRLHRSLIKAFPTAEQPVHSHARFILRELILRPGPLINDELLAARLGIDKDRSSDWKKLINRT